jgi:hypothetical protein
MKNKSQFGSSGPLSQKFLAASSLLTANPKFNKFDSQDLITPAKTGLGSKKVSEANLIVSNKKLISQHESSLSAIHTSTIHDSEA